jgi:hypothetical protein
MSSLRTEVIFVVVATAVVLSAMLAVRYASTTAANADGWKDKNKGCKGEPVPHKPECKTDKKKDCDYMNMQKLYFNLICSIGAL